MKFTFNGSRNFLIKKFGTGIDTMLKVKKYSKDESYSFLTWEDAEYFLKEIVGLEATTITAIHSGVTASTTIGNNYQHDTRANAEMTVFFKQPKAEEYVIYAVGFHKPPGKHDYSIKEYYSGDFEKGRTVTLSGNGIKF